ncbi:unnamed protein product [Lupinus luteus]|uniref:Uncharacterized protein n=1 Tax=Lupinus luteus TaxID=3873 RepID=A0AAV1WBP4_LUPLU
MNQRGIPLRGDSDWPEEAMAGWGLESCHDEEEDDDVKPLLSRPSAAMLRDRERAQKVGVVNKPFLVIEDGTKQKGSLKGKEVVVEEDKTQSRVSFAKKKDEKTGPYPNGPNWTQTCGILKEILPAGKFIPPNREGAGLGLSSWAVTGECSTPFIKDAIADPDSSLCNRFGLEDLNHGVGKI